MNKSLMLMLVTLDPCGVSEHNAKRGEVADVEATLKKFDPKKAIILPLSGERLALRARDLNRWRAYNDGLAEARRTGKAIALVFVDDSYPLRLDPLILNPRIADILDRDFVCIKVNPEVEKKLAAVLDVRAQPYLVVTRSNLKIVACTYDFANSDSLLRIMHKATGKAE